MNKTLIILPIFFLSACQEQKNTDDTPYMVDVQKILNQEDTLSQIFEKNGPKKYDSEEVEIIGYIDVENNRLYSDELLYFDYPSINVLDNGLSLSLDINIKALDNYTCPNDMVKIKATYHFENSADKQRHHLTDITKIYTYDFTPFPDGGTGALIECYSAK